MKTRTFLTTLLLFLLFFNGAILLMTVKTLKDSIGGVKERCLAEHYVVASALLKDLSALEGRGAALEPAIPELMRPYTRFSQGGGGFHLYQAGRRVYSSLPEAGPDPEWDALSDGNRLLAVGADEPVYLKVSGRLPQPFQEITLVYRYPLQETLDSWKQTRNTLYLSGAVFSAMLAACLLLLLNRVFRPLAQIHTVSRSIAAGEYGKRLPIPGRDELAGMARSFNEMAEEIQRQMAELNRAAEQKQQFIDNFAHELRTPLTTIYGYAEYLQRAAVSEEEKVTAAGYILSECRRMQGMASQLLELALLRTDEIRREEVSVAELFATAETALAVNAAGQSVQLRFEEGTGTLYGNRELLESLLVNLAENAIKACDPSGQVFVGFAQTGKRTARLWVRDNGRGMTEEELSHITEAFYRADKARSRAAGGAGLGLSICAQIADLHGAELRFSSEKGKGTTAEVNFITPS